MTDSDQALALPRAVGFFDDDTLAFGAEWLVKIQRSGNAMHMTVIHGIPKPPDGRDLTNQEIWAIYRNCIAALGETIYEAPDSGSANVIGKLGPGRSPLGDLLVMERGKAS